MEDFGPPFFAYQLLITLEKKLHINLLGKFLMVNFNYQIKNKQYVQRKRTLLH
jgi:hypothetical protein